MRGERIERLQRHAADRAGAGPLVPHLGMHWAGVDDVRRPFWFGRGIQIFLRLGLEFGPAFGIAEEIVRAVIMGDIAFGARGLGRHHHSADGIARRRRSAGGQMVVVDGSHAADYTPGGYACNRVPYFFVNTNTN